MEYDERGQLVIVRTSNQEEPVIEKIIRPRVRGVRRGRRRRRSQSAGDFAQAVQRVLDAGAQDYHRKGALGGINMMRYPNLPLILSWWCCWQRYMVYIADGVGQLLPVRQGGEMQEEQGNGEGEDVETIGQDPADWVPNGGKEFFVEYRLSGSGAQPGTGFLQQMVNNPNVTEESKSPLKPES